MKQLKITLAVIVITGIVGGAYYIDYKMYKAKYPNTTVWMWLIDDNR